MCCLKLRSVLTVCKVLKLLNLLLCVFCFTLGMESCIPAKRDYLGYGRAAWVSGLEQLLPRTKTTTLRLLARVVQSGLRVGGAVPPHPLLTHLKLNKNVVF